MIAKCIGVCPKLFLKFGLAPFFNKVWIKFFSFLITVKCKGVFPSLFLILQSALFCNKSNKKLKLLFKTEICKGVFPSSFGTSGEAFKDNNFVNELISFDINANINGVFPVSESILEFIRDMFGQYFDIKLLLFPRGLSWG